MARMTHGARRRTAYLGGAGSGAGAVTRVLIAINVLVYLAELATGAGVNANSGWIFEKGVLVSSAFDSHGHLVGVAHGDYWRLLTAAFLHYGPIHLGMNMLALYWFGTPVEQYLGRVRFLLVYLVSGLAGSAGALLVTPNSPTVGASGAIFGIMGAALVLERQRAYVLGGNAIGIILINLVFSFTFANISIGGHIGGLIGGALCMLALSRFGRGHGAYCRLGALGIGGVVAVAVASVLIAYYRARGYA
jgi:membrane associated rhomboid family serine protease